MKNLSKYAKNRTVREMIRRFVRISEVRDGDVIALKSGTILTTNDNISKLSRAFSRTGRKNVVLVVVDSLDDLSILDEEKMNDLGWVRNHL